MTSDRDLKDDLLEQVNTYIMSNISPQYCHFDRGIWLSLEHLTRTWADNNKYGVILVTAGAIFDRDGKIGRDSDDDASRMKSVGGKERVAIPSHYYKVILRQDKDGWKSIAFLLPHTNTDHGTSWTEVKPDLIDAIVSINVIEKSASLRLHPTLNRNELIESISGSGWDFDTGRSNFNSSIRDDHACVTSVI
jgi:endonuclease G